MEANERAICAPPRAGGLPWQESARRVLCALGLWHSVRTAGSAPEFPRVIGWLATKAVSGWRRSTAAVGVRWVRRDARQRQGRDAGAWFRARARFSRRDASIVVRKGGSWSSVLGRRAYWAHGVDFDQPPGCSHAVLGSQFCTLCRCFGVVQPAASFCYCQLCPAFTAFSYYTRVAPTTFFLLHSHVASRCCTKLSLVPVRTSTTYTF